MEGDKGETPEECLKNNNNIIIGCYLFSRQALITLVSRVTHHPRKSGVPDVTRLSLWTIEPHGFSSPFVHRGAANRWTPAGRSGCVSPAGCRPDAFMPRENKRTSFHVQQRGTGLSFCLLPLNLRETTEFIPGWSQVPHLSPIRLLQWQKTSGFSADELRPTYCRHFTGESRPVAERWRWWQKETL